MQELIAAGMSRSTVSKGVKTGQIVKIADAPGLYAQPGRQLHAEEDVIRVALRAPRAVICLLTAMRLHALLAPPTGEVWIAIAGKGRPPAMKAPPVRVVHMEADALRYGLDEQWLDGVRVAVTNPAKTVADGFKYRRLIGTRAAAHALRSCLEQGRATADDLWAAAEKDRVTALVGPLLEAFV
ncbi:MAG: transcriptional regulator [Rubrivivax sp.]|nr:transcriptional regulator [Rubrivivax sp.]